MAVLSLLFASCEGIRIILDDDPIPDRPVASAGRDRAAPAAEPAAPVAGTALVRAPRPLVVAVLPAVVDHELHRQGIRPDPLALQKQLIAELGEDPDLRVLDAAASDPDVLGVRLVPGRRAFRAEELASIRQRCGADLVVALRLEWTGRRNQATCSITALIAATHDRGAATTTTLPNVRAETAAIGQAVPTAFRFVRTTIDRDLAPRLAAPSR